MTHDEYTDIAKPRFEKLGIKLSGIQEYDDSVEAVNKAEAIFIGGGNTFVLMNYFLIIY